MFLNVICRRRLEGRSTVRALSKQFPNWTGWQREVVGGRWRAHAQSAHAHPSPSSAACAHTLCLRRNRGDGEPGRPHPVERGTILFLRGQINERETGSTTRARRDWSTIRSSHTFPCSGVPLLHGSVAQGPASPAPAIPAGRTLVVSRRTWKREVLGSIVPKIDP
jgi:hypothetical protein